MIMVGVLALLGQSNVYADEYDEDFYEEVDQNYDECEENYDENDDENEGGYDEDDDENEEDYDEDEMYEDGLVIEMDDDWKPYAYKNGSPAPEGWHKTQVWKDPIWEKEHTNWIYVLPNSGGRILESSWILDNGLVYFAGSSGETASDKAIAVRDGAERGDVIYNVQTKQFEALPYSLKTTHYVFVNADGASTYDNFIYSISGQSYMDWSANMEQQVREYEQQKADLNNATNWGTADLYINQSMAKAGYYSYEVMQRYEINPHFAGGFAATYKIKVPSNSSYHIGYLRIIVGPDGRYYGSEF